MCLLPWFILAFIAGVVVTFYIIMEIMEDRAKDGTPTELGKKVYVFKEVEVK